MKKLKVMHVLSDTNVGGAGTLLYNTISCGDRQRFEYVVVLPKGSRLIERFEVLHCRTLSVDALKDQSGSMRDVWALMRLICTERPDVFHAHAALSARIAARLCRVPVCVYTRHCVFPLARHQKNVLFRTAFRCLGHCLSDRVVAVADAAKQNLMELGMDEGHIEVIVNGVRPVRSADEAEISALRARYGIGSEHFVVGMVARLEEYKGQRTLLRAAARCLAESDDFRFLLIGDGSGLEEYRRLAKTLGIENQVVFVGFVEDMAPYYAVMDVNVNASFGTETSSLALSEGMSVGVAAVASDYGGNPKMVVPGENGILFPAKDDAALARALLRLYGDRELLRRLGEGARRHYSERLTAQGMVRHLEEMYLMLWENAKKSKGAEQISKVNG